jgi:hypothetical protein
LAISDLPMLMGAMLVVVGTILIVVQLVRPTERGHVPLTRRAEISPKGVSLRRTYRRLVMIGFGTVLLLAGGIIG